MLNPVNSEIIQIAEAVAREKGIARDIVITAMEQAIGVAGRKKYGHEHNIRAEISQKNGEIKLYRVLTVVEIVENTFTEISLEDAKEKDPELNIGDEVSELLPPIDLGRVAAQIAKQVVVKAVKDAEKEKQYHDFKDRVGEILSGSVKRVEFGNIVVDLGRTEAIIKRDQSIRNEIFRVNDRIKAYVQKVERDNKGPQIFLSRTDDMMLAKMFEVEIPEVYDGNIEIKAVARDPGSKAKVAVYASDSSIDPVGSCVGVRGSRIRNISNELNGEKVDVILWSKDVAQFVINALSPAEISKVVIDEDKHRVEIVVPNDQLSIAIGKRGQNVRLASKLTKWNIDVMTDEQESKRRSEEFTNNTELFASILDVEEVIAQLLAASGFASIEQIANTEISSLSSIEGFDIDLATEIQNRAADYVENKNTEIVNQLEELGVDQDFLDSVNLTPENYLKLAEYGIKTLEDLGELTVYEFKSVVPESGLSDKEIEVLINLGREKE